MIVSPRAMAFAGLASAVLIAMIGDATAGGGSGPLARHRCEVLSRLSRIHERGPRTTSRNRFIVLAIGGEPQSYVQCIFVPSDTRMLCEASSGAYRYRPEDGLRLRQSEESLAALAALGFMRKDAAGNFERDIELGNPPDLAVAADLMLATLSRAYGAGPRSRIEITAPKAAEFDGRCGGVALPEPKGPPQGMPATGR